MRPSRFKNLICMADLFFALSASLFLLAAIEGKTLEGEDPLVDRDPDPAEIEAAVEQLETHTATVESQLEALETLSQRLEMTPQPSADPQSEEAP
jgi:hypothetical protein